MSPLSALRPPDGQRTLAERAYDSLHEAIVTGVLAPGERLPIEELAESLDMSPMPIREALRQLDAVGLVENIPHRGARVTQLSIQDLRELYEARLALEPRLVHLAATRFTPDDSAFARQKLAEHIDAYESSNLADLWATHTAFHFALYNAAKSRWLTRAIQPLWETSGIFRFAMLPCPNDREVRRLEHERILSACDEHDAELAAMEIYNHLARTANLVANQMGSDDEFELCDQPSELYRLSPSASIQAFQLRP